MMDFYKKGAILIVSGPSGCGKSTLLKEVFENIKDSYFSISATTRKPRDGEKDGVDYIFTSKEEFEKNIKIGNFLEYAKVHDNYYGTPLSPIINALNDGKLVIFDIDVQGHCLVRKDMNEITTSVFITTKNLRTLEQRLQNRSSDSNETIQKRLNNSKIEINSFKEYDYFLINDDLKESSKQLLSIANIARLKTNLFDKNEIIKNWLN